MAPNIAGLLERNFNDENDTTFLWIAFVVLNVLDHITTAMNVGIYGPAVEMNPIIRPLIETWGMYAVALWKIAWVSAAYVFLRNILKYRAMLLLNIILLLVVCGNVFLH